MRGLESLQCCFADQLCLHQLREKSTGLLSAPHRRQPRTDARRPGIGRNCAQIMPRTALGHAEQREERWDWWKPNHAKSVFRSLLHFSAALYLVTSCAEWITHCNFRILIPFKLETYIWTEWWLEATPLLLSMGLLTLWNFSWPHDWPHGQTHDQPKYQPDDQCHNGPHDRPQNWPHAMFFLYARKSEHETWLNFG